MSNNSWWTRSNRTLLVWAAIGCCGTAPASAQVNVTMQQNDIARTGQNLNETILTPANVGSSQFGRVFSQPVVGQILAQPLYLSNVTINGNLHNVVYVATQSDVVYAFDAMSNEGSNGVPLWQATLLDAAHGAASGAQLYGNLGITGTPVIDPSSKTLYVVGATLEAGLAVYRLHALDVTSGAEKFGGPVTITASVAGTAPDGSGGMVELSPRSQNQRSALLLLNGIIYVGFGAFNEGEEIAWHGWLVAYNAATLLKTGVFCATPNGENGGLWMGGNGPAADQLDPVNHPYGRMFLATGNGDFTATKPYGVSMDYGDSILDLDLTNGVPVVTDDFTPNIQAVLQTDDYDQGSGGVLILPNQTAGSYPHLLVQAGKSGNIYLVDRDNLGGYSMTTNHVVQLLPGAVGGPGPLANTGVWSSPAYWNGHVYYWGVYDNLKSFSLQNGLLSTTPVKSSELSIFPGSTPVISANGTSQGIVWTINKQTAGQANLQAHLATNVATTLYSSYTNPTRDRAGPEVNFAVPTIANGKVYVGTGNQLDVYGLISPAQTSTPVISPASVAYAGSQRIAISDPSAKATIYYTTDGTPATPQSTVYSGPFTITANERINAVAVAPSLSVSNQAWGIYTLESTAPPTFLRDAVAYSSPQSVALADTTPGAVIHFTTDGSTPSTASPTYSGPITVSGIETVSAMAAAPGHMNSGIVSNAYQVIAGSLIQVNKSGGFASTSGLSLLGAATVTNNALQLSTAGKGNQTSAAWYTSPVNVQSFTTDFYFLESAAVADGFTFTLQDSSSGTQALGAGKSGLGYQGIPSSIAVKFDLFNNVGEAVNSTGVYTNGAAPTLPAEDMTGSGVDLHGGDILHARIAYDGTTLTLTVTDTVTGARYTTSTAVNVPAVIGGNVAYAGFTAGTTRGAATQTILNWTYRRRD